MVVIDLGSFDAFVVDLDGVITRTAAVHARAWKQLFDEGLAARGARTGEPFVPFDLDADYRRYVDGKPRQVGVRSFLASRAIEEPRQTVVGLGKRKRRFDIHVPRSTGLVPDRAGSPPTESPPAGSG